NENHGTTKALRSKEEAHDYRYFPEPDIPPVILLDEDIATIKLQMPEMPNDRILRYTSEYGLPQNDAKLLVADKGLSDFYDAAVGFYPQYKQISNIVVVELLRRLNDSGSAVENLKFTAEQLAKLVKMSDDGIVSKDAAKEILRELFENGGDAQQVAKDNGYIMDNDASVVEKAADEILAANPKAASEYKEGSAKVFGFLMGQMCKALGKSANPQVIRKVLTDKLNSL
ncbi:MAG: Asp-tRNA(Asn)/Glu-tRNA(Gln) amidotransferase GatCAB subunit B, partial [Oscillospiraceae bacterium]